MPKNWCQLTVCFDPPFWVGVYQRCADGRLETARIVFGAEPKDYEVYDFLQRNWAKLVFAPSVPEDATASRPRNPKRLQRAIKAQLSGQGGSTKSQQALQLLREQGKLLRQERRHGEKEAKKARRFSLRQEKRKEKRRGH